jgi:Secretion system C-terminal sorting domain
LCRIGQIGCVNAAGNNQTETLNLTGLVPGTLYYFRIYGASNSVSTRNGTYNFCGTTGLSATVLPVELSSLNASVKNDKVELNWTVESALNNLYFEIERSNDANQYQTIGKVTGAGTTAQTVQYSFTDIAPAANTNFYRLKLVDNNGSFKYSAVVTAKLDGKIKNALQVYPNPVTDKINLKITAAAAVNSTIKIFNNTGGVVYEKNKKLVKGENIIVISRPDDLARGLYFLQVNTNNEILNISVISIQ